LSCPLVGGWRGESGGEEEGESEMKLTEEEGRGGGTFLKI